MGTTIVGVQYVLNLTLLQLFPERRRRIPLNQNHFEALCKYDRYRQVEMEIWSTSWETQALLRIIKHQQTVSFSLAIFGVMSPTNAHKMTVCGS
jgi:hypothetical protein